ncbi:MAG: DNA mismatch repair endonuclease MutL [Verrucomicrobiota bacterium]
MSRIRLLSEIVASQVAAGEVVERPASVVKELVENSIDAGARKIDILIRRGGIALIRVIDDGCGMDRDDALLCLERHATSKIRSAEDLQAVATLGFRGEALPSIASVSRFRLTTREPEAIAGTDIIVNGGKIDVVRDGGEAPGTQVEVRSLFYNLPARRKFLRSENTESRNLEHQLHLQAIGHPQIAFTLVREDRAAFQLPPAASLNERIRDLYGGELLERLLPINDADVNGVEISGLIGQAGLSRQTRAQQLVFVNGRAIESPLVTSALREGYHTALMRGQFPVTFLFVRLDPAFVDVNVHPAKREVRFRDPNGVREAIVAAIQRTLETGRVDWQEKFRAPSESVDGPTPVLPQSSSSANLTLRPEIVSTEPSDRELPQLGGTIESGRGGSPNSPRAIEVNRPYQNQAPAGATQQFQIIGVLNKLYVLMENTDGLVLVDQHAAHERVLFEELRRRMEEQGVPSQKLLIPQTFDLPPRDAEWIERSMSILQKMGIGIEGFGPNTFKIDSMPAFLTTSDPVSFMQRVIDDLKNASDRSSAFRLGEEMIASTVCRHAVKANDPLRYLEVEKLIRDLLACDLPYCCPHGRPTMIQISNAELEKKFGRKV